MKLSISSQGEVPTATASLWKMSRNDSKGFPVDRTLRFAKHFYTHRISRKAGVKDWSSGVTFRLRDNGRAA